MDDATGPDSLRLFLTGAGSDGGAQTDPNLSLGNFRSSTEEAGLGVTRASAIANITIAYAAVLNGVGDGTLTATGADTLKWTPPGGGQGADVTILNGETKVIPGSDTDKYVRVTRTSATALTGTETDTLALTLNNVAGFDNVSSAEAAAGDDEYRALMCKNVNSVDVEAIKVYLATLGTQRVSGTAQLGASGAGTITTATASGFSDWPASGWCRIETSAAALREIVYYSSRTDTSLTVPANGRARLGTTAAAGAATDLIYPVPGCRLAIEAPVANAIQTIANEGTTPTGVTWSTAITAAAGLSIGTLAAAALYGLWIHREIPIGAVARPRVTQDLRFAFDAA